jgi:hypothetical protein
MQALLLFPAADRPETRPLREKYAAVVPAAGSVVDLLVRAKDKQTGQPLKAHQIVAQVGRQSNSSCSAGYICAAFLHCKSVKSISIACRNIDSLGLFAQSGSKHHR